MGHKMTKSNQSYLIIIFGLMPSNIMPWTFFTEIFLNFQIMKILLMTPATAVTIPKSES